MEHHPRTSAGGGVLPIKQRTHTTHTDKEYKMSEDTKTSKVEAVPFNDDMTKAEMVEHLKDVHGYSQLRVGYGQAQTLSEKTKITKADMIKFHDRLHEGLSRDDLYRCNQHGQRLSDGDYYAAPGRHGVVRVPVVEHVHTSVLPTASDLDRERVERAKSGERITDKPLSQSERKVLLELINNDFGSTKQQMYEMAADALNATLRDLKEKHQSNREAEAKFRQEFDKVLADARNKVGQMRSAMQSQGIAVDGTDIIAGRQGYRDPLTFKYEAYDREVTRAKDENRQMLERALMTLERQRLTAVRRVLIHGITEQAEQLLNEVPTAKQMMVEAAQEQQVKQIETTT